MYPYIDDLMPQGGKRPKHCKQAELEVQAYVTLYHRNHLALSSTNLAILILIMTIRPTVALLPPPLRRIHALTVRRLVSHTTTESFRLRRSLLPLRHPTHTALLTQCLAVSNVLCVSCAALGRGLLCFGRVRGIGRGFCGTELAAGLAVCVLEAQIAFVSVQRLVSASHFRWSWWSVLSRLAAGFGVHEVGGHGCSAYFCNAICSVLVPERRELA